MVVIAVVCLAVLAYTYVGYPILIAALARLFPLQQLRDPTYQPSVTVCMSVYNAAEYLDGKLRSLLEQDYPPEKLEILVYSDGSTDETDVRLAELAAREPRVRFIRGDQRRGKPTGLNRLREEARSDVLLLTDARQPLSPDSVRSLVEHLSDPCVGCATGNLVLTGGTGSGAYWRYEKFIRKNEGRFRGVVGMTGSIAALRKVDLVTLPPDLILDDVWIPMRLRLTGRRVIFVEEAIAYDSAFDDFREFERKVRTLAGNYQLFARMPTLLSPFTNPSWFETMSHKVLRLVCPWALVGLALTTTAALADTTTLGEAPWLLAGGQTLFYGASLAGRRAGPVGGLARTFLVLNAAAVVGLCRFLTGRQLVTW